MHKVKLKPSDKINRLTLIELMPKIDYVKRWRCRCDCGNEKIILQQSLTSGNTKSCGCLSKERLTRHGGYYFPEYQIWAGMKSRCYNPKNRSFKDYGGRGIKVCERWLNSFEKFYADMGNRPTPKHTLDRKNVNGDYKPSNCRWVTQSEQHNNKRNNNLITFEGKTLTETQWRKRMGLGRNLIRRRIAEGWSVEKALTTPSQQKKGGQTYP